MPESQASQSISAAIKAWLLAEIFAWQTAANARFDRIDAALAQLTKQGAIEMKNLDDLTAAVEREQTVQQSAITLLTQLSAQIKAAGTDPVKLDALVTQLDTQTTALAAAVTANTPAAEPLP